MGRAETLGTGGGGRERDRERSLPELGCISLCCLNHEKQGCGSIAAVEALVKTRMKRGWQHTLGHDSMNHIDTGGEGGRVNAAERGLAAIVNLGIRLQLKQIGFCSTALS